MGDDFFSQHSYNNARLSSMRVGSYEPASKRALVGIKPSDLGLTIDDEDSNVGAHLNSAHSRTRAATMMASLEPINEAVSALKNIRR